MKFKHFILAGAMAAGFWSCKSSGTDTTSADDTKIYTAEEMKDNPLIAESTLPYGAPQFDKIQEEHFRPALLYALQTENEEMEKIANNEEDPTFENTLVAMEKASALVDRVSSVFYALTGAHTNDFLKELQTEMSPRFAEHYDNILLNDKLFQRIKTIYDNRESLGIEGEDLSLLEVTYMDFIKAGANLSDSDKTKLKEINSKLATLSNDFGQKVLEGTNEGSLTVDDVKKLAGLTESEISSLKEADKDEWSIMLQNTTQQPLNQSLEDRDTRMELFHKSWNRTDHGKNSTLDIIKQMVELRIEKARLLDYPNYAAWNLQDTMAQTVETVDEFFEQLVPATVATADREAVVLQEKINSDNLDFELEPWDWNYFAEEVRKEKYDLDEGQIKPYFEMKSVLENGVFYAATKLYGITFKERTDIPTYHPDVMVYELFEEDGSELGLFYADFFKRESKRGGAWMSNFVTQTKLLDQKPVIYNVCNFTKPAAGEPALLTYDNVETMFHEFGHALHGFFADQKYPSISGTSVARDFVEYPSQANEHWGLYPEVLKNYAKHYETGEVIPQALIDKIKKAGTYNQGFKFGEVLAAAELDFNFHTLDAMPAGFDAVRFEKESLESENLWMDNVPPRYRASYFSHIFAGGYAASYYAYLWTEMLALDTGNWFDENGGLTRSNGQRYRDMILSRGNTINYKEAYKAFRGADPSPEAILKGKGLTQ